MQELSPPAFWLLADRLAVRRRIGYVAIPVIIAASVAMFVLTWPLSRLATFSAMIGLAGLWSLAITVATAVWEGRLVAADPQRVGESRARTLGSTLGGWGRAFVALILGVCAVCLLAEVAAGASGRRVLLYLAILMACWLLAGLNVARELRRPAIAVDAASLAVDRRLRAEAILPNAYLFAVAIQIMVATSTSETAKAWLFEIEFGGNAVIYLGAIAFGRFLRFDPLAPAEATA